MARKDSALGTPIPLPRGDGRGAGSWVRRNAWSIGGAFAVLTLGGFWWHRRRRLRASDLEPVSQQWLADHEYEEGQRGADG
jgi:hypothetical protein